MASSRSNQKTYTQTTLADVARKAGVSTATVSRVVNQTGQVAQKTIEHVRQVIQETGYRPHASARSLASGRTFTIGFIAPNLSSTFFAELMDGIDEAASEQNYSLLIHTTRGRPASGPGYHRPLAAHDTDGIIVFTDTLGKDELTFLKQVRFPVVMLLKTSEPPLGIPCVVFENEQSSFQLTEHLIVQHGSRRIAFIRGAKNEEDSYHREKGYCQALEKHGIPVDPELISGFGDIESAEQTVRRWVDQGLKMDAIFSFDDDRAIRTISILQQQGIRVPEDIRVVGFDDIPLTKFFAPPLTTVAAPARQAGYEAARQLIKLIKGRKTEPVKFLPTRIVIRRSCGCP